MKPSTLIALLIISFAFLQQGLTHHIQTEPPVGKTQILLVGTHYLPADIFKPLRQREVRNLIENLARFQADQIMVDVPFRSTWEESLNHTYQAFLEREYVPNRNAREQIGFRLAKMNGLSELKGIDISSGFNLGTSLREASLQGAGHAVSQLIRKGKGIARAKNEHAANRSLSQYFAYLNHPQNLMHEHGMYVNGLSRLGKGQSHIGTQLLGEWYEYHMQLFANLIHSMNQPGERIIILVESSHIPILKQLIEDDPSLEWVNPLPYLEIQ